MTDKISALKRIEMEVTVWATDRIAFGEDRARVMLDARMKLETMSAYVRAQR